MFNGGRKRKASGKGSQVGAKRARLGASRKGWYSVGGSTRRFTQGRPSQVRIPGNIGIAQRAFVKLKSHVIGGFTSTSGAVSVTEDMLKLNSCADPLGTLGSITSVGSTQWFAAYQRYRVHAAKVKITFANPTADSGPFHFAMFPHSATQTVPTTMAQMVGQPYSRHGVMNHGGSDPKVLSFYVTMAQVFGQSKEAIAADDTYSALVSASPSQVAVCTAALQTLDGSSNITLALFAVELTQWVEFYQPKLLDSA